MAAGDVVNTAARLQAAAPVNGDPRRRADLPRHRAASIEYRDAEPVKAKGKSEPVAVWEAVAGALAVRRRRRQQAGAPLVGRERELDVLAAALARVRARARRRSS